MMATWFFRRGKRIRLVDDHDDVTLIEWCAWKAWRR